MKPVPTAEMLPGQMQSHATNSMATISLEQVAQLSGVGTADLKGLVDYGVLTPVTPVSEPWAFRLGCVTTLQRADHLRHDLALDDHGFALAMMLLSQITELDGEFDTARSMLPNCRAEGHLESRAD